jgi:hypothetical protein
MKQDHTAEIEMKYDEADVKSIFAVVAEWGPLTISVNDEVVGYGLFKTGATKEEADSAAGFLNALHKSLTNPCTYKEGAACSIRKKEET